MRQFLIVLVPVISSIALMVELAWLGWALKLMIAAAPWWITAAVLASHFLTVFGLAIALDKRPQLRVL